MRVATWFFTGYAAVATLDLLQSGTPIATAAQEAPRTKPINLKVLPADIAPAHLGKMMKRFKKDLGVSCSYCHVENRETAKIDYVSDDNPAQARACLRFASPASGEFLAKPRKEFTERIEQLLAEKAPVDTLISANTP